MSSGILSVKNIKFIIIALVCLVLIFLNPRGLFSPIRFVFSEATYPIQKTFYLLGKTISGTFSVLTSISELRGENERLLRENNELIGKLAMLKDAERENKVLREQLELSPREKFELVASFVIGQDNQKLGSWLMLDRGSADGIKLGMPVIAYEGILVGRITEVSINSSKVTLPSDSTSTVNAVDAETDARGVTQGSYGLGIVLDMVAQTDVLNEGDLVVTSGLGSSMPKGLLIGKIQQVRMSSDRLFQQAIIVPRVNYSKLDVVFIIKN